MIERFFYGDDIRWFLGTVVNHLDPAGLRRVQVRVHGIHPHQHVNVQNADLPWASVLAPSTSGGTSGIGLAPALLPGAQVFGIYMDGKISQLPLILGSIPHVHVPSENQVANNQNIPRSNPVVVGYGPGEVDPALAAAAGITSSSSPSAGGANLKYSVLSMAETEKIITTEANLRFMDPNVAIRIFRAEGGPYYQSQVPRSGTGSINGLEASFGPYQLYNAGGLGSQYERRTGRKLINDNTREGITNQIRFALDAAVQSGWGAWYGRIPAGVATRDGFTSRSRQVRNWK